MTANDKHAIRTLFDDYLRMYTTQDGYHTELFSDDFSGFGCADNALVKSREDWLATSQQNLSRLKEPLRIKLNDVLIQSLADRVAVVTGLLTVYLPAQGPALSPKAVRLVLVCRRESSDWKISHSSASIPCDLVKDSEVYSAQELTLQQQTLEQQQAAEALRKSEAHFRMMTENAVDVVWKLDEHYFFTYISPADEKRRGYHANEVIGHHVFEMFDEDGITSIKRAAEQRHESERRGMPLTEVTFEAKHRCKDGSWIWGEICYNTELDANGKVIGFYGMSREITERKQIQDQVRELAFYDPLTRLPNRHLLNDRLGQAMVASKRNGHYGALMFLDLDNFKPINDSHGHSAGDLLLIEVAQRLKKCVREMDTIARFGGDEFIVVLSELELDPTQSYVQAQRVAENIRTTLADSYQLSLNYEDKANTHIEHFCTASIGVVLFLGQAVSIDELFKRADFSMYKAKESGRNSIRFYNPAEQASLDDSQYANSLGA